MANQPQLEGKQLSAQGVEAAKGYERLATQVGLLSMNIVNTGGFLADLEEGLRASQVSFDTTLNAFEATIPEYEPVVQDELRKGLKNIRDSWKLIMELPFEAGRSFAEKAKAVSEHHDLCIKEYAQVDPNVN